MLGSLKSSLTVGSENARDCGDALIICNLQTGLSMSLNFRPNHNGTSFSSHFHFYSSQLLVLLGRRPSIASVMRKKLHSPTSPTLQCIASETPSIPSTAAYLIFSDGEMTMVIEKDHITATAKRREDFIVATNHDRTDENQATAHENARYAAALHRINRRVPCGKCDEETLCSASLKPGGRKSSALSRWTRESTMPQMARMKISASV